MTNKQKQNLLAYLGLYKGEIDGDFGAQSSEATKQFQKERNLTPDGVFGPKTEEEILKVIGEGIKINNTNTTTTTSSSTNKVVINTTTTTNNKTGVFAGIKYFTEDEFTCKCGGRHCKGDTATMSRILLEEADIMREELGPVIVTSGIRCPVHNANEGGVSNSRHLYGKAMDFYIQGKTAYQIEAYLNTRPRIRYHYKIEGTNNRCVHMDVT